MFAKNPNQSMIAKNRLNSTWTPLSNEETNNKIFDERRALVGKWYDKWSDEQRRRILEDLLLKSKPRQLEHARDVIRERVPASHKDFTRVVPRVVSLYIFSFLDPRSLCRCSRVCWHWHYLVELDQLWLPKCLKLGWYLTFTPSPFEVGVWKRNYTEHIKTLQVLRPKEPPHLDLEQFHISSQKEEKRSKPKPKTTPWRGSDRVPTDTWRFNVLENDDVVEVVNKLRKKNYYGKDAKSVSSAAKSKVKTGQHSLSTAQRSQSLSRLHTMNYSPATSPDRPLWAQSMTSMNGATSVNGQSMAVTRPAPSGPTLKAASLHTTKTVSRPVTARSSRDLPSSQLFPSRPWEVTETPDSD